MVYELRGAKLVYSIDVASALHFVDEASDDGLVLFDGHGFFPFLIPRSQLYPREATGDNLVVFELSKRYLHRGCGEVFVRFELSLAALVINLTAPL